MAAVSRPYLAAITPPGLRFSEVLPPPDLSVQPPAGAPPLPQAVPQSAGSAALPSADVRPAPIAPGTTSAAPADPVAPRPASPVPPPILPDETRSKVRPEDFLPFFQFPANAANANGVTVVVPATLTPPTPPGNQPPSSATYRQQ